MDTMMRHTLSDRRRTLWITVMVVAASYVGVALPYPILAPLFLMEGSAIAPTGLSPEVALGYVLALYPLGMFFGNQILGTVADRIGRKEALLISLGGSSVGYLLSAFAVGQDSFVLLLVSRGVTGLFEGNVPIARAIAADLSPEIPKEVSFGHISGAIYVGYLLGPLAGGFLAGQSFSLPFVVAGAFTGIIFTLAARLIRTNRRLAVAPGNAATSMNPWVLLRSSTVLRFFIANLIVSLAVSLFYQFYPVVLVRQYGFDSPSIGTITFVMTVTLLLSSVWLVKALRRYLSSIIAIAVASLLFSGFLIAAAVLNNTVGIWLIFAGIGLVIPQIQTNITIVTSDQLGSEVQGQLMGMLGAGGAFGAAAVIIIGSYMAAYDPVAPLIAASVLALTAAVFVTSAARFAIGVGQDTFNNDDDNDLNSVLS